MTPDASPDVDARGVVWMPEPRGRALFATSCRQVAPPGGEVPDDDGVPRVRHADEGRAGVDPHDDVFVSRLRVRPAPDVIPFIPATSHSSE